MGQKEKPVKVQNAVYILEYTLIKLKRVYMLSNLEETR